MSKNKVEDIIENFILDKFYQAYLQYEIRNGSDINEIEQGVLTEIEQMSELGSNHVKELLKEELKLYLDFHEKQLGYDSYTDKKKNLYIKVRDEEVEEKTTRILTTIKKIIKSKW